MVDSSSIRVHQHGANVKKGGARCAEGHDARALCTGAFAGRPDHQILDALVDANGLRSRSSSPEGQAHDGKLRRGLLDRLGTGQTLLADAPTTAMRFGISSGASAPGPSTDPCRVAQRPGLQSFCLYRQRNRDRDASSTKLKHFRAVATRFEKHDANYLAALKLAAIRSGIGFMSW